MKNFEYVAKKNVQICLILKSVTFTYIVLKLNSPLHLQISESYIPFKLTDLLMNYLWKKAAEGELGIFYFLSFSPLP
jgi:hypothetical protein